MFHIGKTLEQDWVDCLLPILEAKYATGTAEVQQLRQKSTVAKYVKGERRGEIRVFKKEPTVAHVPAIEPLTGNPITKKWEDCNTE